MGKCVSSSVVTTILALGASLVHAQNCACGPTYCVDTAQYKVALDKKKKQLNTDHPQRLVALFDKLDHCEAAVTTSPDGFSLFREFKDGSITVDAWTEENENNGAVDVASASGLLKSCRVIITRRAFKCCGAANYDKRPDYVQRLDLNTTATVACEQSTTRMLQSSVRAASATSGR